MQLIPTFPVQNPIMAASILISSYISKVKIQVSSMPYDSSFVLCYNTGAVSEDKCGGYQ